MPVQKFLLSNDLREYGESASCLLRLFRGAVQETVIRAAGDWLVFQPVWLSCCFETPRLKDVPVPLRPRET